MQKPTISVVTITRNNQAGLQQTVASVLKQGYEKLEFIVVDGASTDGTREFLASFDPKNLKWISEADRGISDAFNKGMDLASGDVVIFMNSGDTFASATTLCRATELIPAEANLKESVVYGDSYNVVDSECYLVRADHTEMNRHCSIGHQAAFIGRDLCRRFKYDTRLAVSMDYDYWLQLLSTRVPFIKIDVIMAKFEANGISRSFKYRAHSAILDYYLVALHNGRTLTVRDAFSLCLRSIRAYFSACLRQLAGRRVIFVTKRILIRLRIKNAPVRDTEVNDISN